MLYGIIQMHFFVRMYVLQHDITTFLAESLFVFYLLDVVF